MALHTISVFFCTHSFPPIHTYSHLFSTFQAVTGKGSSAKRKAQPADDDEDDDSEAEEPSPAAKPRKRASVSSRSLPVL